MARVWSGYFKTKVVTALRNHRRKHYHASYKIPGTSLDRSWSHDAVKIIVLGVEIRIGRVIGFEAGGKQSKIADDDLVAMDFSLKLSLCVDILPVL